MTPTIERDDRGHWDEESIMPPRPTQSRQQFVKLCECGCGQPTLVAISSHARAGYVRGQPLRFLQSHRSAVASEKRLAYYHAKTRPVAERFWAKVRKTATCWLWQGSQKNGYGRFRVHKGAGGLRQAHAVAYELLVGPIPPGLQIDHVRARGCLHRACVNPAHLEPVTAAVNNSRSNSATARNARKTHCPQGHEYTAENTILLKSGGRRCRICKQLESRLGPTQRRKLREIQSRHSCEMNEATGSN